MKSQFHTTLRAAARVLRASLAALSLAAVFGAGAADVFSVAALEMEVERGDVRAMMQLASKYELGEGVAKNYLKSNYLYCTAARMGDPDALYRLGTIYANGRGVARDHSMAAGLYARAAAQGHEQSKRLVQYMQEQLRVRPNPDMPACKQPETPLALRLTRELVSVRTVAPDAKESR